MKITIITVVRNNKDMIMDAIESVRSQTYENIEYIVIDGASTDGTTEIIKSHLDKIDKFVSTNDNGLYDAMNKGIQMASGDIIGFLNSDDFYANNNVLLEVMKEFSANPHLDACYADLIYTDKLTSKKSIRYWKSGNFIPGSFSKGWNPPHPTFFVHRRIYDQFGTFDLRYNIASDIDLMIRFLEIHKINVKYIPHLWVKMRLGGLSNKSIKHRIQLNFEILKALKSYNLSRNIIIFFTFKLISRTLQLFKGITH